MTSAVHDWRLGLAGLVFIGLIYSWNYWCRGPISRWLAPWTGLQRKVPLRSVEFIVRVPFYSVPGIIGYVLLDLARPGVAIPVQFSVESVMAGAVLGLGFVAAGSTLAQGTLLIATLLLQHNHRRPNPVVDLTALGDTGWLRGYNLARRTLPPTVFLLFTAISITGEEVAFRGVLLPLLASGFEPTMGLVLATAAFVGIQRMYMPSWYIALVPMSGALLMGIVLGYLALVRHDMLPLIVSHFSFFVISMLLFAGPGGPDAEPWNSLIRCKRRLNRLLLNLWGICCNWDKEVRAFFSDTASPPATQELSANHPRDHK